MPPLSLLHPATQGLSAEIARFAAELLEGAPAADVVATVLRLQNRQVAINSLLTTVRDMAIDMTKIPPLPPGSSVPQALGEALHLLLELAAADVAAPTDDERELLVRLTADRSDMMDRLRRRLLVEMQAASPAAQSALFAITGQFERAVWLIRQVALLSGPAESDDPQLASQIATEPAESQTACEDRI